MRFGTVEIKTIPGILNPDMEAAAKVLKDLAAHEPVLHVGFSARSDAGGLPRFVNELVDALRVKGIRADVFEIAPESRADHGVVLETWRICMAIPRAMLYRRGPRRLVHAHGYSSPLAFFVLLMAKVWGWPTVYTPHFHPTGNSPAWLRWIHDRTIGAVSLELSNVIVAVTQSERELLSALRPGISYRLVVIPDPAPSFVSVTLHPLKHQVVQETVLYVGRLEPTKGIRVLERVLEALWGSLPEVVLSVVTPGGSLSDSFERWSKSQAPGRVRVLVALSDEELREAYDSHAVLIVPSEYEAFGLVALEAQCRGLPVVATDVGGLRSIVKDGQTGFLLPTDDVEGLADAAKRILSDERLRQTFCKNAMRLADDFLPEKVATLYQAVYLRASSAVPD